MKETSWEGDLSQIELYLVKFTSANIHVCTRLAKGCSFFLSDVLVGDYTSNQHKVKGVTQQVLKTK